jgi:CRISPR system Cascade subunit CasE
MYLTKLVLNANHPQARRDLGSAYEMHLTLSRAFVQNADTPPVRFLWRLERVRYPVVQHSAGAGGRSGNWRELEMFPGYPTKSWATGGGLAQSDPK